MAYTGIFCTELEIQYKAGANASASITEALRNSFVEQAESAINTATRYNWTDKYATLNTDVKRVLSEAASNLAAIYCISYDMSGFTSRGEAESMVTILRDAYLRCLSVLRDIKVQTFMEGA